MTKVQSHVMLILHNVRNELSNVSKKNKGTTKCDTTVKCDVGTTQYKDRIVKCDVLVTWYSKLPTSGYHTLYKKIKKGIVELL